MQKMYGGCNLSVVLHLIILIVTLIFFFVMFILFFQPDTLKLGTMMGVFIPCVQSILGIIYYIRFSW